MKILRSIQSKVCVDGSLMKEFQLDEPLTKEFLTFLENFGTVRVLTHLRLPYFSFEKERFISIKGFIGEGIVEVRYRKEFVDITNDFFHLLLYYYQKGSTGKKTLGGIIASIEWKMDIRQGKNKSIKNQDELI